MPDGDRALVIGCARRRREALEELYRRHGAAVYEVADALLKDGARATAITQSVFLGLWEDPGGFSSTGLSVRALLVSNAHRYATDLLRLEALTRPNSSNAPAPG